MFKHGSIFTMSIYRLRSTPILLAASSGGLSVLKGLIELGADYKRLDGEHNGIVSLAAMRFHTNVLEYLIEWSNPEIKVWEILVGKYNCLGCVYNCVTYITVKFQ